MQPGWEVQTRNQIRVSWGPAADNSLLGGLAHQIPDTYLGPTPTKATPRALLSPLGFLPLPPWGWQKLPYPGPMAHTSVAPTGPPSDLCPAIRPWPCPSLSRALLFSGLQSPPL